jgi:hypothetical protein
MKTQIPTEIEAPMMPKTLMVMATPIISTMMMMVMVF